jgi:putative ABC transport system permease protein
MWNLALKEVGAHRFRLLLTTLAVVLGVTFVSGTLVLTDTSQKLFDDRFTSRSAGTDLTIRTAVAFDEAMGVEVEHEPVPAGLLTRTRATAGVARAAGVISGKGTVLVDGSPVSSGQSLLMSWADAPFGGFAITSGRAPQRSGEVVLDQDTAHRAGVRIGADVTVQAGRVGRFEVVGLARSTHRAAYAGSSIALTDTGAAQSLLRLGDRFSEIRVQAADDTAV